MNRLPFCDRTTCRSELAVFASLGFAGVLMVALAAAQVTWFVGGGDRITAGVAGRSEPLAVATSPDDARSVATNVNGPADSPTAARDLATGKIRSGGNS